MSKILVKSNGFGGVSYMIDPRQRGGPTFMDLGRRVLDTNLGGGQRLGALAGLAGKIGAGAVAANQAAYGLQAGNLSAPFGAMDQYAALDPTRGMKLTDAENERRMREQAVEQVAQERMQEQARRDAEIAAQPQAQPAEQIDLPVYARGTGQMRLPTRGNVMTPVPTTATQAPVPDPSMPPAEAVTPQVQNLGTTMGNTVQQPLPINSTQNTAGVIQESVHPEHHDNIIEEADRIKRLGQVTGEAQKSYVDMVYDEMGDIFYKQSAEDVANAITFTFLKHRR